MVLCGRLFRVAQTEHGPIELLAEMQCAALWDGVFGICGSKIMQSVRAINLITLRKRTGAYYMNEVHLISNQKSFFFAAIQVKSTLIFNWPHPAVEIGVHC